MCDQDGLHLIKRAGFLDSLGHMPRAVIVNPIWVRVFCGCARTKKSNALGASHTLFTGWAYSGLSNGQACSFIGL